MEGGTRDVRLEWMPADIAHYIILPKVWMEVTSLMSCRPENAHCFSSHYIKDMHTSISRPSIQVSRVRRIKRREPTANLSAQYLMSCKRHDRGIIRMGFPISRDIAFPSIVEALLSTERIVLVPSWRYPPQIPELQLLIFPITSDIVPIVTTSDTGDTLLMANEQSDRLIIPLS